MTKYEMYVLINRMLEELEEKEVARVYEYTQRIWINSTDEKSDYFRSFLLQCNRIYCYRV